MQTPPATPLVGRKEELRILSDALESANRGSGGVHFIAGESGVGKTRLSTAAGELARKKGFATVVGRSYPVETGIPYGLFADAFVPVVRSMPAAQLQVVARGSIAELVTLFPALRADNMDSRPLTDDEVKPRLLDTFSRFLHRLAAREPLFIILDNLHWADPSSLELLHVIARGAASHRILLLCTYDEARRDDNPTLRVMEQSLRSLGVLQSRRMLPFDRDETRELIRTQFGVDDVAVGDFPERLHDRTGGNPFFIEATLHALVGEGALHRNGGGHWTGWSVGELAMPRTVRDAIDQRLERLPQHARLAATIAAVVGVQVPHALLATLAELEPTQLLDAVDTLRRERILAEADVERETGYAFIHPMVREALYTSLSRVRARALHGRIAEALEVRFGERALDHADALAAHFRHVDTPQLAQRALRYLLAAGSSALDRGASREAVETLEAAHALVGTAAADDRTVETLLDLLARAHQRNGALKRATALWSAALESARARGDLAQVATFERRLGVTAVWSGRYDEAIAHYDRGLEAARCDDTLSAMLRLRRSAVFLDVGRADEAAADIRDALAIAERVADPLLLSRVHHALQWLAMWRGPSHAVREHGEQALSFANAADDRVAAWNAEWAMTVHCGLTADAAGTARHQAAATALADELRSPVLRLWTVEALIEYRTSSGDWNGAIALAERTIADARAFSQTALLPRLLVWASLIRFGRGELERGAAEMEEAWQLSGAGEAKRRHVNVHAVVPAHVSRAAWHVARLEYREALEVAEAGIAIVDRTGYTAWAIHRLLPIAGEAALYLRDFDAAARLGERLRNEATQLGHPLGLAWADACFAIIRHLQGDNHGAIPLLERAAQALEAIPFVDYAARVRRVLVDAYCNYGQIEHCLRELRNIHEIFARLGAAPALDNVRDKFRELGVRPPARSPAEGVGSLTAREAEIARLIAERKSNKEIAAVLDISARTVGTHLSNIFSKLGIDSRGELTDVVRSGSLSG